MYVVVSLLKDYPALLFICLARPTILLIFQLWVIFKETVLICILVPVGCQKMH